MLTNCEHFLFFFILAQPAFQMTIVMRASNMSFILGK